MHFIKNIVSRQIFDSRGNPTVEAEVFLDNDISATAISPSGASTGAFEAYELRDNDQKNFLVHAFDMDKTYKFENLLVCLCYLYIKKR